MNIEFLFFIYLSYKMSRLLLYRIRNIEHKYHIITIGQVTKILYAIPLNVNVHDIIIKLLRSGRLDIYEKLSVFYSFVTEYSLIAAYIPYNKWPAEYSQLLRIANSITRDMMEKAIEYNVLDNFYYLSGLTHEYMVIGYAQRILTEKNIRMGRAMLVRNISLKHSSAVKKIRYANDAIIGDIANVLFSETQNYNLAIKKTIKLAEYLLGPIDKKYYEFLSTEYFRKILRRYKV